MWWLIKPPDSWWLVVERENRSIDSCSGRPTKDKRTAVYYGGGFVFDVPHLHRRTDIDGNATSTRRHFDNCASETKTMRQTRPSRSPNEIQEIQEEETFLRSPAGHRRWTAHKRPFNCVDAVEGWNGWVLAGKRERERRSVIGSVVSSVISHAIAYGVSLHVVTRRRRRITHSISIDC